jgi:septal ring factor EnvC (AmiA/AmiB activator)
MTFIVIAAVLLTIGIGFVAWDFRQKYNLASKELTDIKGQIGDIEAKAHKKASEIIAAAQSKLDVLKKEVTKLESEAAQAKQNITISTQARLKDLAELEATYAGKKLEIAKLEELQMAIRRRMEGVGDEYILPIHDLLDGLASNFEYNDAGKKLKEARDYSKLLIKEKRAVTCAWGNDAYKKDAIRLMLETFNAQVDVALEGLKREENVGKVLQEIRDTFESLNDYGTRCMRASVEPVYLEARLDEAKWGAIAAELKHQEREEQREMAAKLREDAMIEREIEREKRLAEEEEILARRAMEKAEAEALKKEAQLRAEHEKKLKELERAMQEAEKKTAEQRDQLKAEIAIKMADLEAAAAEANAEQRAKHELEKAELERKLAEAEAHKRTASMAEQTKRGHVYVISNRGSFGESMLKIGMTRRLDPHERVDELGDASVPFDFDIHALIPSDNAPELENDLHRIFADKRVNKVNHRKEFFRVSVKEVKEVFDSRNVHASWTIVAQSREYLETLTWEERMNRDPEQKKKWIEKFGARRSKDEDKESSPPQ